MMAGLEHVPSSSHGVISEQCCVEPSIKWVSLLDLTEQVWEVRINCFSEKVCGEQACWLPILDMCHIV